MLDFPNAPVDAQEYLGSNGVRYLWSAAHTVWRSNTGSGSSPTPVTTYGVAYAKSFGTVENDIADDTEELNNAIDSCIASGKELYIEGICRCGGDVPLIHTVQLRGPGAVRVAGGPKWRVEQSFLNTGYGVLDPNVMFVDNALGSNTNSGLSDIYPLKTLSEAARLIGLKNIPTQGLCEISIAQGVLSAENNFYQMSSPRATPMSVHGPVVSAWDNSNPPKEPIAITAITLATPPVVTANAHGYTNGQTIFIGLATRSGGMHESDGAMYLVAGAAANTFQLNTLANVPVVGVGWSAYTGSGKVYDCNGNAPKCIVYGDGTSVGITVDGAGSQIWFTDIHFINCGTKIGTSTSGGGLLAMNASYVRTFNVHATDCGYGILIRDKSYGLITGGRFLGNYSGNWAIDARYSFGVANTASAALTTTPIYKNNSAGVDVWEMSNGHCDGVIFENNTFHIWVRRGNSHCIGLYNRYINSTGLDAIGVMVEHGGFFSTDSFSVWTGNYEPRVLRKYGSHMYPDINVVRYSWQTTQKLSGSVVITTSETTIFTEPVQQDQWNVQLQAIRLKLVFLGTWANGTLTFSFKLGAAVLYTHVIPLNASVREGGIEAEISATGFDSMRGSFRAHDRIGATTTPTFDIINGSLATNVDQDFVVTAQLANAADSCTIYAYEVERLGW